MKDKIQSLVEGIKILSDGLMLSLKKEQIQESSDYVIKMKNYLDKVQEYLEMKKAIDNN